MKSRRRRGCARKAVDKGSPRGQATPRPSGERGASVATTTTAGSQQPAAGPAAAMVCATAQTFPQMLKQQSLSRVVNPSPGLAQPGVPPDSAASLASFPGPSCDQEELVVASPSLADPVTPPAEEATFVTGRPGRSEPTTACMGTSSNDLPAGSSQSHLQSPQFLYQVGISHPEAFSSAGGKVRSQGDGDVFLYASITHGTGLSPRSEDTFEGRLGTEKPSSVQETVRVVATAQQKPEAIAGQAAPCSGRPESESPVQLTELVAVCVSKLSPYPPVADCSFCPTTTYGDSGARSLLPPICTMASFRGSGSRSEEAALYRSYYKTELHEQNAASYQVPGKALTSLDHEVRLTASHSLPEHVEYHHHHQQQQQHASTDPCSSCGPDCPGLAWGAYPSPCPNSALCRSYCCDGESGCCSGCLQHSSPDSVQQLYQPHLPPTSAGSLYACPSLVVAKASASPEELRPSEATGQRWGGMAGCREASYPAQVGLPAAGTYIPGGYTSACTTPQGGLSTAGDRSSNADSSGSAYYSDDSCGTDGGSMRDIQQEILRSDLQRHIYQNYSSHLIAGTYPPVGEDDDEDQNDDDEESPTTTGESEGAESDGGSRRRASSAKRRDPKRKGSSPFASSSPSAAGGTTTTGKRRRRRTQTPNQRRAANMRERKRMCHLNTAFDALKNRLPSVRSRKKLSRIQTLRAAICYIGILSDCLHSA